MSITTCNIGGGAADLSRPLGPALTSENAAA
jgi:hypothetical protein